MRWIYRLPLPFALPKKAKKKTHFLFVKTNVPSGGRDGLRANADTNGSLRGRRSHLQVVDAARRNGSARRKLNGRQHNLFCCVLLSFSTFRVVVSKKKVRIKNKRKKDEFYFLSFFVRSSVDDERLVLILINNKQTPFSGSNQTDKGRFGTDPDLLVCQRNSQNF